MRRNLPRYFLLSFLSFAFFSVVFQAIAHAQVVTDQSELQSPLASPAVPTPTIYMGPPQTSNNTVQKNTTPPSPTPTIFVTTQTATKTQATEKTTQSISPTDTPEAPTISPTATPAPTAIPSPQPSTQPGSVDLNALFSQYSSQYSVSVDELKKIAQCESGFNTNSDTGVYAGMFQFSASTWSSERSAMGLDANPDLRKNAEEAIKTTAYMLAHGGENAWPNCH